MRIGTTIGSPVYPDESDSPRVAEVIVNKDEDMSYEAAIVVGTDRKWYADHDGADEVIEADSASEVTARLWRDGKCSWYVAEALFRAAFLTLDANALRMADHGWRHKDPLG